MKRVVCIGWSLAHHATAEGLGVGRPHQRCCVGEGLGPPLIEQTSALAPAASENLLVPQRHSLMDRRQLPRKFGSNQLDCELVTEQALEASCFCKLSSFWSLM